MLGLDILSPIEKIGAIYDYVTGHVTYDSAGENRYTLYGALIDGRAVCQGYALLIERMLNDNQLPSKYISGHRTDSIHVDCDVFHLVGLEVFACPLIGLFAMSRKTEELCVLATRIIASGFLFAGGNIAIQGVFQALGCGLDSLIVSLLRLCVIVLPLAWLFARFENAVFLIWWAFPIAELAAFAAAVVFLFRANNKMIKPMKESREICTSRFQGKIVKNVC